MKFILANCGRGMNSPFSQSLQCTEKSTAHSSAQVLGESWKGVAHVSALALSSVPDSELPGNTDNELRDWEVTCFPFQP